MPCIDDADACGASVCFWASSFFYFIYVQKKEQHDDNNNQIVVQHKFYGRIDDLNPRFWLLPCNTVHKQRVRVVCNYPNCLLLKSIYDKETIYSSSYWVVVEDRRKPSIYVEEKTRKQEGATLTIKKQKRHKQAWEKHNKQTATTAKQAHRQASLIGDVWTTLVPGSYYELNLFQSSRQNRNFDNLYDLYDWWVLIILLIVPANRQQAYLINEALPAVCFEYECFESIMFEAQTFFTFISRIIKSPWNRNYDVVFVFLIFYIHVGTGMRYVSNTVSVILQSSIRTYQDTQDIH